MEQVIRTTGLGAAAGDGRKQFPAPADDPCIKFGVICDSSLAVTVLFQFYHDSD